MSRRWGVLVSFAVALGLLGVAPPASAGSPGPTTYRPQTADDLRQAFVDASADGTDSVIVLPVGPGLITCVSDTPLVHDPVDPAEQLELRGNGTELRGSCPDEPAIAHDGTGDLVLRHVEVVAGPIAGAPGSGGGGGVDVSGGADLTLVDAVVAQHDSSTAGGGVLVEDGGSLSMLRSTLAANEAPEGGGAWVDGDVRLRESVVSGNGDLDPASQGGGIFTNGTLEARRSTFLFNVAGDGAAVLADDVMLEAVTAANNGSGEGGAEIVASGGLTSTASLLRGFPETDLCDVGTGSTTGGYNLVEDDSCGLDGTGDEVGTTELAPNLDFTWLVPTPRGGDSVVDAIPASHPACADQPHDQRQVDRPQGEGCEIGAIEQPTPFSDIGGHIVYDPRSSAAVVPSANPFFAEISWLADAGITTGYGDGTFRPSTGVSRAAMAAFLLRLADVEPPVPTTPTFTDVGPGHPFFAEIEWLASTGIAGGYPDDTFRPANPVSRQAMAAFLFRFEQADFDPPATATFLDVSPTHPFFTEIEWMADAGISAGYQSGAWQPATNVSRQAMAHFLFVLADVGEDL